MAHRQSQPLPNQGGGGGASLPSAGGGHLGPGGGGGFALAASGSGLLHPAAAAVRTAGVTSSPVYGSGNHIDAAAVGAVAPPAGYRSAAGAHEAMIPAARAVPLEDLDRIFAGLRSKYRLLDTGTNAGAGQRRRGRRRRATCDIGYRPPNIPVLTAPRPR